MKFNYVAKQKLDIEDVNRIKELVEICFEYVNIVFKFELDYKLADAQLIEEKQPEKNEFFCFNESNDLVGYFGICQFSQDIIEISGLVRPKYRKLGIGSKLLNMALEEAKNRAGNILLLTDSKSKAAHSFITKHEGIKDFSEFEMILNLESITIPTLYSDLELIKASNNDAIEIMKQNCAFTNSDFNPNMEIDLYPETEEKKGIIVYLAKQNNTIIGKIHIACLETTGWIYGFFIYPQFRGKGYGKAILYKAFALLKQKNFLYSKLQVDTINTVAYNLYTKMGYQIDFAIDYYRINTKKESDKNG